MALEIVTQRSNLFRIPSQKYGIAESQRSSQNNGKSASNDSSKGKSDRPPHQVPATEIHSLDAVDQITGHMPIHPHEINGMGHFTQAVGLLSGAFDVVEAKHECDRAIEFSAIHIALTAQIHDITDAQSERVSDSDQLLDSPLSKALDAALNKESLRRHLSGGGQLATKGSLHFVKKSGLMSEQHHMKPVDEILTHPVLEQLAQFFKLFEAEKASHRTTKWVESVGDIATGGAATGLSLSGILSVFAPVALAIDSVLQLETSVYRQVTDHYRLLAAKSIPDSNITPFSSEINQMNENRLKQQEVVKKTSRLAIAKNVGKAALFSIYQLVTAAPKLIAFGISLGARLVGGKKIASTISAGIVKIDTRVIGALHLSPPEPTRVYLEKEGLLRLLDAWQSADGDTSIKRELVTFVESRYPAFRPIETGDWTRSPAYTLLDNPSIAIKLKLRLGSKRVGIIEESTE